MGLRPAIRAHEVVGPIWIDLLNPTPDETAKVAAECAIHVPSRDSLQELDTSSRLRAEGQVLYMSMPLALQDATAGFAPLPLGFILSPELLLTVRYSEIHAFAEVKAHVEKDPHMGSAACSSSCRTAWWTSAPICFRTGAVIWPKCRQVPLAETRTRRRHAVSALHMPYAKASRESEPPGITCHAFAEGLLGLQRIVGFVSEMATDWLLPELKTRLKTAQQDLTSLVDFEAHLSGKTQFLLDAILGFINTEQNEIFKVLTIVSVVGIPPTLIASMYGMNFHNMPELAWRWGYPYGLALIALSTLLPILWFKRRGWW